MIASTILTENQNGFSEHSLIATSVHNGIITITDSIDSKTSVNFALLLKHLAEEQKDIKILIDCPGGEVNAGLSMYDLIQNYPYNIDIYCIGMAASMAAILLAGGKKGHRFILPHAKVMVHEPLMSNGFGGSATTIEQQAKNILNIKFVLNDILAKHTGKDMDEINEATSFDNFMTAQEAIEFGLCDEIAHIF